MTLIPVSGKRKKGGPPLVAVIYFTLPSSLSCLPSFSVWVLGPAALRCLCSVFVPKDEDQSLICHMKSNLLQAKQTTVWLLPSIWSNVFREKAQREACVSSQLSTIYVFLDFRKQSSQPVIMTWILNFAYWQGMMPTVQRLWNITQPWWQQSRAAEHL